MKTKILIIVLFMGISSFVMAQPADKGEGRTFRGAEWNGRMKNGPANALNLTDAQKDAFKKSMMAMQKELKPLKNELGEVMAHQKTLVSDDTPDMKAIDKNLERIGNLKVEMAKIRVKYRLEMRAQLTDEQRMKFDMFNDRMKNGRGEWAMDRMREMKREHQMN